MPPEEDVSPGAGWGLRLANGTAGPLPIPTRGALERAGAETGLLRSTILRLA